MHLRPRPLLAAAALSLAVTVIGCGSSENPSKDATAAVNTYYQALSAGNAARVCQTLSAAGRQQLVDDLKDIGGATGCVDAARKARAVLAAYLPAAAFRQLGRVEAQEAKVEQDTATATVPFTSALGAQRVQLVKEKDGWKVNVSAATDTPTAQARILPKLPGDTRPRVEGRWRVVYTGGANDPLRTTWKVTPKCSVGACGFTGKSSLRHSKFPFTFDKTVGDYISKNTDTESCGYQATKEVVVKHAYDLGDNWQLGVTKAVFADGRQIATEMAATRHLTATLTSAAKAAGCGAYEGYPEDEQVRLVRISPPAGDEVAVNTGGVADE